MNFKKVWLQSESETFSKNDTLIVKGIAIVLMVFHHCFLSPSKYAGQRVSFWPFEEESVNIVCQQLKICVCIFVFLSAYALTLSLKNAVDSNEVKKIVTHRYIRTIGGFVFIFIALQLFSLLSGKGWYTHRYGTGPISIIYMIIDGFGLSFLLGTPRFSSVFWYMSLAQAIIVLVPLLYFLYRKTGPILLLLLTMIVAYSFQSVPRYDLLYIPDYIICIGSAIIVADKNVFFVIKRESMYFKKCSILCFVIRFVIELMLIVVSIYLRYLTRGISLVPIIDAIIPFQIALFVYEFVSHIPLLKSLLQLLGKYSMGMFMVHTLIRRSWYYDLTYSFTNFVEIACFLVCISFIVSFVLQKAQHLLQYDRLLGMIEKKLNSIEREKDKRI